ncbi:DNA-binding response regulator [Marivirga lumbricoides]|uniref:DNA-binding response regulator n=1 Tax=Marivirga lumbricoides TaxID=1046115 RepID=A0ABQ1N5C1_9BACT|nr:DNA-binding response regulator [Marivirga lumbricoides]
MKLKCIIVDDEPLGRNVINNHLRSFSDLIVVANCNDAMEAFNILKNEQIDFMFLDINMPEITGIDFIKSLKKKPLVIITTAYREYAVESYELDVFDYLVKPISLQRFIKAIDKVTGHFKLLSSRNEPQREENNHMFIKVDKKMIKVNFGDILYIESLKDYVRVVTRLGNYITHHNLRSITEILPSDRFIRIHRSFVVAIDEINSLEGNDIRVENKVLPIGRNYQKMIKDLIGMDKI